jgi:hypothetical protein
VLDDEIVRPSRGREDAARVTRRGRIASDVVAIFGGELLESEWFGGVDV